MFRRERRTRKTTKTKDINSKALLPEMSVMKYK